MQIGIIYKLIICKDLINTLCTHWSSEYKFSYKYRPGERKEDGQVTYIYICEKCLPDHCVRPRRIQEGEAYILQQHPDTTSLLRVDIGKRGKQKLKDYYIMILQKSRGGFLPRGWASCLTIGASATMAATFQRLGTSIMSTHGMYLN